MRFMRRPARLVPAAAFLALACAALGCGAPAPAEQSLPVRSTRHGLTVGGCACPTSGNCAALSFSDIPADGLYYVTTFGGGSDTQPMSCGGTADGTWAYIANTARFGCGGKVLIEGNGKRCVAEARDCGPNQCVEEAASSSGCASHFPIIDASPFITKYLFGGGSFGWSDKQIIKVTPVADDTAIGCPGGAVSTPQPEPQPAPQPADAGPAPQPVPQPAPQPVPQPADAGLAPQADSLATATQPPATQPAPTSDAGPTWPDLGGAGIAPDSLYPPSLIGGCAVGGGGGSPSLLASLLLAALILARRRRRGR